MNDTIIRKGKAVGLETSAAAMPLGVEYERLMRDLQKNVEKRYEKKDQGRQDMRKQKQFVIDEISVDETGKDKKTFVFSPGSNDKFFDEPNGKPAYPVSTVPQSQGLVWSD